MSRQVRVESLEALQQLREGLWKFEQAARAAITEAHSDFLRTRRWVEADQMEYWQRELRLRTRQLEQAREAVRQKTLYKTPTGHTASAVEEKQALAAAQRRVEEAQQKIRACQQWRMRLERQAPVFRGALNALSEVNEATIPTAVARLDRMMRAVEAYLAEQPPASRVEPATQQAAMSVALATLDEPIAPPVRVSDDVETVAAGEADAVETSSSADVAAESTDQTPPDDQAYRSAEEETQP